MFLLPRQIKQHIKMPKMLFCNMPTMQKKSSIMYLILMIYLIIFKKLYVKYFLQWQQQDLMYKKENIECLIDRIEEEIRILYQSLSKIIIFYNFFVDQDKIHKLSHFIFVNFRINLKMKNKISFTAVLKDKARLKPSIGYSQTSYTSQQKYPTLSEMLEQFQMDPSEQFTINLNHSYAYNQKSRNGSINMIRSRNIEQDPQNNVNFQNWIESMTHSNSNGNSSLHKKSLLGNNFNGTIKRKSIAKPIKTSQRQQELQSNDYYQNRPSQVYMLSSKQNQIHKNNHFSQKCQPINIKVQAKPLQKTGVRFNQKTKFESQSSQQMVQSQQKQTKRKSTTNHQEISPEQILAKCNFKSKEEFPQFGYGQYDYLKQQFDQLKEQKISEINNYGKKSIKRQKVQELVSSVMKSIYSQIQNMANTIKNEKLKKKQSLNSNEPSEEMLLDSQKNKEEQKIQNSFDQREEMTRRRIQEYKGKVNEVMSEIDQIKSKGNQNMNNFQYNQVKSFKNLDQQEPSFRREQNFYVHEKQHQKKNIKTNVNNSSTRQNEMANNSVGYSFSNNLVCQHSFNNQLNSHYYQTPQQNQRENYYKKISEQHIYKPDQEQVNQTQTQDKEVKFLLPNIDQVKSEQEYNGFEERNVQQSQELKFRNKNQQKNLIEVDNEYIKNIQSVNYEPYQSETQYHLPLQSSYKPPQNMFKQFQHQNSKLIQNQNSNNAGSTYKYNHIQIKRRESSSPQVEKQYFLKEQQLKSQKTFEEQQVFTNSIKKTTFSSKTFNSYLSGGKNKILQSQQVLKPDQQQGLKNLEDSQKFSNTYSPNQQYFKTLESSIRQQEPIKDTCEVQILQKRTIKNSPQTKNNFKFSSPQNFNNSTSHNTNNDSTKFNLTKFNNNELSSSQQNKIIKKQESPYAIAKDMIQLHKINNNAQNYSYQASSFTKIDSNNKVIQSKQVHERSQHGLLNGINRNDYQFYYKESNVSLGDQIQKQSNQIQKHHFLLKNHQQNNKKIESSSLLQMKPLQFNTENHEEVKKTYTLLTNDSSVVNIPQQHKKIISIPTSLNKMQVNQSIEIEALSSQDKVNTTNQQIKFSISKYQVSKPAKHISIVSSHSRTLSQPIDHVTNMQNLNKEKSSSPKVIDINLTSEIQGLNIKPYEQVKAQNNHQSKYGDKQNIFHKLSIKQSMNMDPLQDTTKQNFNSMNQSLDISQSFKIDEHTGKDKKEPLIKLSRNLNGSNAHQSSYGIKKSITETIKLNGIENTKLSSNRNKINISVKQSMKQSVNSSGMDFDLALD